MTELDLREEVCAFAKGWLGRKEADGSHRAIVDMYNTIRPLPRGYKVTYTDPWCATFVSAVGKALGLDDIIYPECGCGPMVTLYKQHGRWMEDDAYLPKKGDVIFYDWDDNGAGDNQGQPDHVGIVWSAYGDNVTVIEGNKADMVAFRDIKRNGKYIRGYGLPDYAGKADGDEQVVIIPDEPAEPEIPQKNVCQVSLPVLLVGDDGEAVRAAQWLLQKRGFSVGWMGADGEFGDKTQRAVGRFQAENGLERDGVIGKDTWTVLIIGRKET